MVDFHKLRELGFDSENAKERFLGSEEFYFSCMKIYILISARTTSQSSRNYAAPATGKMRWSASTR